MYAENGGRPGDRGAEARGRVQLNTSGSLQQQDDGARRPSLSSLYVIFCQYLSGRLIETRGPGTRRVRDNQPSLVGGQMTDKCTLYDE